MVLIRIQLWGIRDMVECFVRCETDGLNERVRKVEGENDNDS